MTKEFKVNEYLTLKLEDDKTFIYVKGQRFLQCIRLVLQISKSDTNKFEQIDSIDEASEVYDKHLYQNRIVRGAGAIEVRNQTHSITPEQEFAGHCSNIQTWAENNYDTRLLHSNIAFPLLKKKKKLTEVGDLNAKRVFKEENTSGIFIDNDKNRI